MISPTQISKREFYLQGGFTNHKLFRKMRGKVWTYWRVT